MNGLELDTELRAILLAATPETTLSSVNAIVELGFPARTAFVLVFDVLKARAQQATEKAGGK